MYEVFPTHVGMNRNCVKISPQLSGIPHTRGNEPAVNSNSKALSTVFPTYCEDESMRKRGEEVGSKQKRDCLY